MRALLAMSFVYFAAISLILISCVANVKGAGPKIIGSSELVISTGDDFSLLCEGDGHLQWKYPFNISENGDNDKFTETRQGSTNTLNVRQALFYFTGYYSCEQEGYEADRVYVYVKDEMHLLAVKDEHLMTQATVGDTVVIPCRPTSPDVNVSLSSDSVDLDVSLDNYNPREGFILSNLTVTSSGYLYCKVLHGEEELEDVVVNLMVHPKVSELPVPYIQDMGVVEVGKNVVMNCVLNSVLARNFHLKWVRPGYRPMDERVKELKFQVVDDGNQHKTWTLPLEIVNATKDDEGLYKCLLTVDDRIAETEQVLRVRLPHEGFLNVTVEVKDIEERAGGGPARWVGYVHSYPAAKLTWYTPAGQDISFISMHEKYEMKINDSRLVLIIRQPKLLDSGVYRLLANSSDRQQTLTLRLLVRDSPHVRVDAVPLYAVNGVVNIPCNVLGYPLPRVVWIFKRCDILRGRDCDQAPDVPVPGDLISETSLEQMYHVQSTLRWNTSAPGELKCRAINAEGVGQDVARIRVTDVPQGFALHPPGLIVVGDSPVLSCAVSTYNYTELLQWFYAPDNETAPSFLTDNSNIEITAHHGIYSIKSNLHLKNVSLNDSGLYICRVKQLVNASLEDHVVHITVQELEPAEIIYTNLNETVITIDAWHAQPVNFTCKAGGVPPPQVRWLHNDKPVLGGEDYNVELLDNNQTLMLKNISPDDEGDYVCQVFNQGGYLTKWISLTLIGEERIPSALIAGIAVVSALLLALITYLIVYACRERRRRRELSMAGLINFKEGAVQSLNPALTVHEQADLLPYHPKWEFPRHKLKLGKQLGVGAFGVVLKAEAEGIKPGERTTTVAVKMVKRHSEAALVRALAGELKIMAHLGRHAHVVNLLGAVTEHLSQRELLLIVEFCRFGNLNNYLRNNRSRFVDQLDSVTGLLDLTRTSAIGYDRNRIAGNSIRYATLAFCRSVESAQFSGASADTESTIAYCNSPGPGDVRGDYRFEEALPLNTTVLISWSYQIARGMEWLAGRRVLHGDLAARNVLLTDGNVVKICDFGMARNIYSSPEYHKSGNDPLPLKWMAIESVRDQVFSTQSDVWSYGVVLWELFSLAAMPYPALTFPDILHKLVDGYRMEKPDFAPTRLYEIMTECWSADPAKRPTFTELSCKLGVLLEDSEREHYLELQEEYHRQNELPEQDYLAMVREPTYDAGHSYVNVRDPPSPGYMDMSGDNHELVPMLPPPPESDYLTPRDAPFTSIAVSNPSYEKAAQSSPDANVYGAINKKPIKDKISYFEGFWKKDTKQ